MSCIDIATAYRWLKEGGTHLEKSSKDLLELLDQQIQGNSQGAWQTVRLLETIGLKLPDHTECADILSECGYAAYRLGNAEESLRYFQQAIRKYQTAHHQIAMVEWMVGWVEWHIPGSRGQGFVNLRSSIDKFDVLAKHAALGTKDVAWYRNRCQEMRNTLDLLIKDGCTPSPASPVVTTPSTSTASGATGPSASTTTLSPGAISPSVTSTTTPPSMGASTTSAIPDEKDLLRVYGVVAQVPAGGWGALGFDPKTADAYVEVPYVRINDKLHTVKNLRSGGHVINLLADDQHYLVVEVTGDSMNQAGINKGDYVLLRQQDDAKNNDIVAAEIVGMMEDNGTYATLKRFVRRNGEIILRPESNNPSYHEFPMPKMNEGAFIRGVAYAVFKPIKQ